MNALVVLMLLAVPNAQIPLHSLDSIDGIGPTWDSAKLSARIEINRDRRFLVEGTGSLHLAAHSGKALRGNQYMGVMVPLAAADCRRRSLTFDCWTTTPNTFSRLYVRLWNGNRCAASWISQGNPLDPSHRHIELMMDMDSNGFSWEANRADAKLAEKVTAVEFILGTNVSDADIDVYVDDLRVSSTTYQLFSEVTRAKPIYRETPLACGGRAEAILVAPPGEPFAALAARLQARIKALSGVQLPSVSPADATPQRLAATHAVLLGNVCNNPAMQPLYGLLYTPVDDAYPAGDGMLVHSVHDPWGTGRNAIVVGASTSAGLARAVEALLAALPKGPDLVLPKLNRFDLGAAEMKQVRSDARDTTDKAIAEAVERARADFARGAHRGVASRMGQLGFRYARTGEEGLARLYKELALAWYESYLPKPPIYGGPWGMDMDFHLMEMLPAWDLIEESPALSDEDRLRVTRILYEFVTTDVVRKASGALRSKSVRHNHMTFPALGLFYAGRYFDNGYHVPEARSWLRIAEACFELQMRAEKPYEDCNGYGWLVPYHTMRYALATLDPTYFANGNVRRLGDYCILTMDNLGYQVPYGDTGSYQCWWSELPFLRGAAYYHRDGRYAWTLNKKLAVRPDAARFEYTTHVEPREPVDLLGARAWPLDKAYWESFDGPASVPLEKAFDKLVMRSSFDPEREYLLLDGLSNGGHMHYDGNSISRITDRGRIWLADNDYIRSLPKFHNSLLVFRDGRTETIPPYAQLELLADGQQHAASRTTVPGYSGADWRRSILWRKGRFFLVFDQLTAREAGAYDFHCTWHGVGQARLSDEGLELQQQGPRFWIKPAAGPRQSLRDDPELGRNWVGYAFAEPVVRSLRQVQSARLEKNGRVRFINLLYATDDKRPQDFSIAAAGEQWVLLGSGSDRLLAGIAGAEAPAQPAPGLSVAAEAFLVGPQDGFAAGARRIAWGQFSLASPVGLTIEWSGRTWKIRSPAATQVTLSGLSGRPALSGKARLADGASGSICVALQAGESVVQLPDDAPLRGLEAALRAVRAAPSARATEPVIPSAGRVLWSLGGKGMAAASAVAAADLDGDGRDAVLVGSERGDVECLTADGKSRWKFRARGRITAVTSARLDQSKTRHALVGSEDCKVYALSANGSLKWSYELPTYKQAGRVRVLLASDLDGDGRDETIAGGDNWRYYAIDPEGRKLWHYESVHPSSAAAVADLDGDGKREVLCGTVYYWWHCAAADGTKRWSYSVRGPHATVALAANFAGDRTRCAVFGSEDGLIHVIDPRGRPLWQASVGRPRGPPRWPWTSTATARTSCWPARMSFSPVRAGRLGQGSLEELSRRAGALPGGRRRGWRRTPRVVGRL